MPPKFLPSVPWNLGRKVHRTFQAILVAFWGSMLGTGGTCVVTSNEGCEAYKCPAWKPFLRSYTMWNNCTCSPLEDAFGRGLGAGLGSGYFKFLGMKLPCMWSLVKHNFPSKTWDIPHRPWAALAQTTSMGSKHKYTQNESHVGSSGQRPTPKMSMTLFNWQM